MNWIYNEWCWALFNVNFTFEWNFNKTVKYSNVNAVWSCLLGCQSTLAQEPCSSRPDGTVTQTMVKYWQFIPILSSMGQERGRSRRNWVTHWPSVMFNTQASTASIADHVQIHVVCTPSVNSSHSCTLLHCVTTSSMVRFLAPNTKNWNIRTAQVSDAAFQMLSLLSIECSATSEAEFLNSWKRSRTIAPPKMKVVESGVKMNGNLCIEFDTERHPRVMGYLSSLLALW